jgi:hypothetical protein
MNACEKYLQEYYAEHPDAALTVQDVMRLFGVTWSTAWNSLYILWRVDDLERSKVPFDREDRRRDTHVYYKRGYTLVNDNGKYRARKEVE